MISISSQYDAFKALQEIKSQTRKELKVSRIRLQSKVQNFIAPIPDTHRKTTQISRIVSNGFAIYEGLRLGISFISAFRSIFARKRKRRF